jgi:hypothetical protein
VDTYFAPAKRTDRREFKNQIHNISRSPIMEALLKAVSGLLVVLNEDRQVVAVNDEFLKAIGITKPEDVLGLRLGESLSCVHAHEAPNGCGTTPYCITCGAAIAIMAAIVDDRGDEQICALASGKDGTISDISLLVQSKPIRIDGHRWILIFARDITRQQFWINLERVFFHDINNILTSLQGISQLDFMDHPDRSETKRIKEIVERLCSEVSLQRSLSQQKDVKYLLRKSGVSIRDIKHHLGLIVGSHNSLKGKSFHETWPDEDIIVYTDKLLVSRVLGNMVINALEAVQEGDIIKLTTRIEKDNIAWDVWNNGFINDDIQKRIFQRHFSTKPDPGRGLGTYSMKLFGEAYLKGRVSFRSSMESGTTFTFTLPC